MIRFLENIFSGKGSIFYWFSSDKVQNLGKSGITAAACVKPLVKRWHFIVLFSF